MYGTLTLQMQPISLLLPKPREPFPNISYSDLVESLLAFKSPEWYGYRTSNFHKCRDTSFAFLFAGIKDILEGLNLEDFIVVLIWHLHEQVK